MDIKENIYRDEYGIPHIKSKTKEDLFWGQGYADDPNENAWTG